MDVEEAAVGCDGRRFIGRAAFLDVEVAKFGDGQILAKSTLLGGWVTACCYLGKEAAPFRAGPIGRPGGAMSTDRETPKLAPEAVLSRAFRIGQSPIASLPSFMPSVSRNGEATDPQSR